MREVPAPRLMAGTVVVALVLALSRWGTNIGVNPLFICDVLIAISVTHLVASRGIKGSPPRLAGFAGITPLFAVFFAYITVRIVLSMGQSSLIDWARDSIPFLYGALAFVSAASLASAPRSTRDATMRVFRWALTLHLLWMAAIGLTGSGAGFDILGPLSSAPAFQIRPDIDVALIAIALGLNLRQLILGRRRFWNLAGIALGVLVVFATTSTRAGQISLILALGLSFAFTYAASRQARGRRLLMVFSVPVALVAVLVILPTTTAGERLLATVLPDQIVGSSAEQSAQGTQRARELTWSTVIEWTNEEPLRAAIGSGFGNDILAESSTKAFLEGTTYTNVRSPHNWFVGIYARLGAFGFALALAWVGQLVFIAWRRRQDVGHDDLLAFAALTVAAILPVATFGVVLEAPFGAIPFFWAAGILMASRKKPVPDPSGSAFIDLRTTPILRVPRQ